MSLQLILALHVATAGSSIALLRPHAEFSLDEAPAYERLDGVLRAALAQTMPGVQSFDLTNANVVTARGLGVNCLPADAVCLSKLVVLTDVDRVAAPNVTRAGGVFHITVTVVDAAAHTATVEGDVAEGPDDRTRKDARELAAQIAKVSFAVAAPVKPPTAATTPPSTPTPSTPTPAPTPTTTPKPSVTPPAASEPAPRGGAAVPVAGLAVLGSGVAFLAGGAMAAGVAYSALETPKPYADRVPTMIAGQVGVVAAVVGAAAAGVGVWLVLQ